MGGRGASSGARGEAVYNSLPDKTAYEAKDLPELSGSEKQVKWAETLREEADEVLWHYAIHRDGRGNPSGLHDIAIKGRNKIKEYIEDNPLVDTTSGKLRAEKISDQIAAFRELADRVKRYNEIMSNSKASYWIDNRDSTLQNYMFKKWKNYIDGK